MGHPPNAKDANGSIGLIDLREPMAKDKKLPSGDPAKEVSSAELMPSPILEPAQSAVRVMEGEEDRESSGYAPTTPRKSELGDFEFEDPDVLEVGDNVVEEETPETSGALIATGRKSAELADTLEKGPSVVASVFFDAVEIGGQEEMPLSNRLANAMNAVPRPKVKRQRKGVACSKNSECSKLAQERGIPYIGFSRDVCDLSKPQRIDQIRMWAQERSELGESFHLWGSLPCTPWTTWQNLNVPILGEEFEQALVNRRRESRQMVASFSELTDEAVEGGGSSSFEWPRYCSGWGEIQELENMVVRHDMYSSYPRGCAFTLEIHGKRPKKPWRIVSTNARLSAEMESHRCRHPRGFNHDPLEGGKMSFLSGFYNREMATSILCLLFPEKVLEGIPSFPVMSQEEQFSQPKIERIFGRLESGCFLQEAKALAHRLVTRKQIQQDPKAIESIRKEVSDIRSMQVWDDSSVMEYEDVKTRANRSGEEIHLAEVMELGSIKNDELGPSLSQHKGRLVFRGDLTRNQDGLPAKFRELHSQPASLLP